MICQKPPARIPLAGCSSSASGESGRGEAADVMLPLDSGAAVALDVQCVAQPTDTEPAVAVGLERDAMRTGLVGVHFVVHEQVAQQVALGVIERELRLLRPR